MIQDLTSNIQLYQLSSKLKFWRYLLLVLGLVTFLGWFNSIRLNLNGIPKDGLVSLPIIASIFVLVGQLIKRIKVLQFDTDFLYINDTKNIKKIPLENIFKVKMIMVDLNDANFYKLQYKDEDGTVNSARFLPTVNFGLFQEYIRKKNPSMKTQNWTHSFDFDI